MKKILTGIFIVIIVLGALTIYIKQSRDFYYLSDNKYITVWKRIGGVCYVIPGKYYGITKPSDNFIETTNTNALILISDPNSEFDVIVFNNYGEKVNVAVSKLKIEYYAYSQRKQFIESYYSNGKINDGVNYLSIDIKENLVVLNGKKQ